MFAFIATWWFWIVFVEVIFVFAVLAYDKGTAATISLLVFGALLYWLGDVDFITFFKENPSYLVYGALIYFPVGALWSTFKWFMFVLDRKTHYKEFKREFLNDHKLNGLQVTVPMNQRSVDNNLITKEVLEHWKNFCRPRAHQMEIPQVREHKYNIMRWMGYWPFSMIWTLISDFVRRVSRAIYNAIRDMLQAISDRVFADMKEDLK